MLEWLKGKIKWILGTFIGLMLFLVFGLPQFAPAYSDWLDHLFADIHVTARGAFSIPATNQTVRYQTNPLQIKVVNWSEVKATWPSIDGASQYMLRVEARVYPASSDTGLLVYQGTGNTITEPRIANARYTLFYEDATGRWLPACRAHIEGD